MQDSSQIELYAAAVRKLLKGVVYHDDPVWQQLCDYKNAIKAYLGQIGLFLHFDEVYGFAYLKDMIDEDETLDLPRLVRRSKLNFWHTLLLVLLRERFDEHETRNLDNAVLRLQETDIVEMLSMFMREKADERKIEDTAKQCINRLKLDGFLTERHDNYFEVRPLIRARFSADDLENVKASLIAKSAMDDTDESI
jgi:hypothetical protein